MFSYAKEGMGLSPFPARSEKLPQLESDRDLGPGNFLVSSVLVWIVQN